MKKWVYVVFFSGRLWGNYYSKKSAAGEKERLQRLYPKSKIIIEKLKLEVKNGNTVL